MNHLFAFFRFLPVSLLIFVGIMGHKLDLQAQDVGMVSPLVGPTIDATEYQRYNLEELLGWSAIELDSVRILPRGDGQFLAFAYLSDGSPATRELTQSELQALRNQIERLGADLLAAWDKLETRIAAGGEVPVFLFTHLGQVLRGEAVAIDLYQMRLLRRDGVMVITLEEIEQLVIDEVDDAEEPAPVPTGESKFDPPAPITNRYLLAPTAIPTPKNRSSLQVIGFSTLNYHRGLSDKLSLSLGTDVSTIAVSAFTPGVIATGGVFALRYSTPLGDRLHLGGGLVSVGAFLRDGGPGNDVSFLAGYAYGVATYGNPDYNLTLGVGWLGFKGFAAIRTDLLVLPPPVVSFSGTARVSDRIALILENWFLPINDFGPSPGGSTTAVLVILGGRLHYSDYSINGGLGQFLLIDQGAINPAPYPLPYLDFTYLF